MQKVRLCRAWIITSYTFPKRMHEHEPGATYGVDEHTLYLDDYAGY